LCLAGALDRDDVWLAVLFAFLNGFHRVHAELSEPLTPSLRAAERPVFGSRLS